MTTAVSAVLAQVDARLGGHHAWRGRLSGGEQDGAHLVADEHEVLKVLTWRAPGSRAERLLRAVPVVADARARGWPAARWLAAGPLDDGSAFLVQEHVPGRPVGHLDEPSVRAVVAANARQEAIGSPAAVDDSAHLESLLTGDHPWTRAVATSGTAGAALVRHGAQVVARAGAAPIPDQDVVHGDCSSTNVLLDDASGRATFVDCDTIARGCRARDLADLYRQSFVHPSHRNTGAHLLVEAGVAAVGPRVFARCAVAVTYANLAWWTEHRSATELDEACRRAGRLFDALDAL